VWFPVREDSQDTNPNASTHQSPPVLAGMNITFVNGEQLRIDAGFFDNTWQIHNKWLTWEGAHKVAFCEDDREDDQEFFTCMFSNTPSRMMWVAHVVLLWIWHLRDMDSVGPWAECAAVTGGR
jgi:hypothetical protein